MIVIEHAIIDIHITLHIHKHSCKARTRAVLCQVLTCAKCLTCEDIQVFEVCLEYRTMNLVYVRRRGKGMNMQLGVRGSAYISGN